MADKSAVLSYEAMLDEIVRGNRRTSPNWRGLFDATSANANLDTRIRDVFNDTGFVPSRGQYEAVQGMLLEGQSPFEAAARIEQEDEVERRDELLEQSVEGTDEEVPEDEDEPKSAKRS